MPIVVGRVSKQGCTRTPHKQPLIIFTECHTQVLELEPVAGKDKLKQLKVDVGAGGDPLQIVTNAPNVVEGCHLIVATVGSLHLPSAVVCVCLGNRYDFPRTLTFFLCGTTGSKVTMNGEEIEIKEATVCNIYIHTHTQTRTCHIKHKIHLDSFKCMSLRANIRFCCMHAFDLM